MDAVPQTPREEDESGSPPVFSLIYLITVEEAGGWTHEHELHTSARVAIGDVLEAGREGWPGPQVAIEEIDRHPDADGRHAGLAMAWPISTGLRSPQRGRYARR